MKTKFTITSILLIILTSNIFAGGKKHFQSISKLSEFIKLDNYSSLYSELLNNRNNYKEESLLFYEIILKSVMNKPEESNLLINKFKNEFSETDDTTDYYITQTEYNNYVKLCDYKKLKDVGGELISKYKSFIDSSAYVELKDDYVRHTYLLNEKATIVDKKSDTKLKVVKDIAGYTLLTIKGSNDSTVNFIFDTGANVSAITQSSARKLNLRMIQDSKIYVMGATGVRNEARIGMADSMSIGNIKIYNAEFVVFADSLFTFAGGKYVINGAVGFPIFSLFEEITYDDSVIFIPKAPTIKASDPNMFIKADDYILAIEYKNKKYPFFFDTGNMKTFFKKNFYDIDSSSFRSLKDTVFSYGGLGGIVTMKAKQPDEITLMFSGKSFILEKPLIELEYEQMEKNLYGSIGKDFVNCHKKRIMSFKEARLEFE
jgi:hypothetical protein